MTRADTILVAADTLRVGLRPWKLLAGRVDASRLEIIGPEVSSSLATGPSDPSDTKDRPSLTIAEILRGRFYRGPRLEVERLVVRGGRYGVAGRPGSTAPRIDGLTLAARDLALGNTLAFVVDSLALRYTRADSGAGAVRLVLGVSLAAGRLEVGRLRLTGPGSAVSGTANWTPGAPDSMNAVEIDLHAAALDLADLALLVPGQNLAGVVSADIALRGSRLDRVTGSAAIRFTEARVGELHFGPTRLAAAFTDGRAVIAAATIWDGAHTEIDGWMRPLDRAPEYDLELSLGGLPERLPGTPGWGSFVRRGTAETRLRVRGRGYGDAALQVECDAVSGPGRIELQGGLRLRPVLEWELQRLAVESLDVAHWAGDSASSRITGTITAKGRGTKEQQLQITAVWDLGPSSYRQRRILSGSGRARFDGSRLGGALRLATEAGSLAIDTLTASLGDETEFEIPALRFRNVDLARATGSPELRSDLSGTLQLEGKAPGKTPGASGEPAWRRLDATGRLSLESSLFRDRALQAGKAELRWREGTLDADLEVSTDAGRVRLSAEARPFGPRRELDLEKVRFADVDLAAWANVPFATRLHGLLAGKVAARATAGGGGVAADRTDSTATLGLLTAGSVELRLDPSVVGSFALTGGEFAAELSGEDLTTRALVKTAAGDALIEGSAVLGKHGPVGNATLVLPFGVLAGLAGRDTLATAGDLRVAARFQGIDPRTAVIRTGIEGGGHVGRWKVDSLHAALRLADGALAVDTLTLRTNAVAFAASGSVALFESARVAPSDLHLELTSLDPLALQALLGADTLAVAGSRLEARLTGTPSAHSFTVQASLDSVLWNGTSLDVARVEAQGVLNGSWRFVETTATARLRRLRGGTARLDEGEIRASFQDGTLSLDVGAQLDDAHRMKLVAAASRDSSGLRVRLSQADIEAQEALWSLVQPAELRYGNDRLELDSLEVRADSALVLAHGTLDRHGEQNLHLRADHVGLDIVAAWRSRRDLDGMLDGQLSVTGPAAAPRAEGALRVATTAAGAPVGVAQVGLDWDGREARLRAFFASPAMDSVTVAAHVPLEISWFDPNRERDSLADEGEVELRAEARRFPLSALAPLLPPESVSDLQGVLDADFRLSGRRTKMIGEGHVRITDGAAELPSLGVAYQDLRLDGALSGDRFTLRDGRMRSGKGELQLEGDLRVAGPSLVEPHLTVRFRDFMFVNTPDLRVVASGDLQLAGNTSALEISGRVTASDCTYFITSATAGGAQSGTQVVLTPEDVRMLEDAFGYQYAEGAPPLKGVYDPSILDLQVSLDHDNWVRKRNAPVLALGIAGDVHVRKPAHGEIQLEGRITPVPGRSYLEQFGRTFDFVGGEVLLNGGMKEHTVDIRTEYKVRSPSGSSEPEVLVHLDVRGDIDKMRLDLSSEPPLSESEILTYITTGRSPIKPQSQTESGSEAAALAAEIGLSQVTGALEHTVQEKVGLDVLQVRYDASQGATLWAGRYINPTLYVGVQQPLQYREEGLDSSQNPYQTVVDVEYEAYRWLIVNLQGEASLIRSFVRARHAY